MNLSGMDLQILREIDKRDRLGLPAVFDNLVSIGLPRWKALRCCYIIAPREIQKRVEALLNDVS
jgi:hypothetical protein